MLNYQKFVPKYIANLPDTLQKMTNSLLVNVDIPINTKRLKYPCKTDLENFQNQNPPWFGINTWYPNVFFRSNYGLRWMQIPPFFWNMDEF